MSNVIMEMTKEYSPVNQNARLGGIMEKWDHTGLLKGLNEDKGQVVAQLLENQAVELRIWAVVGFRACCCSAYVTT